MWLFVGLKTGDIRRIEPSQAGSDKSEPAQIQCSARDGMGGNSGKILSLWLSMAMQKAHQKMDAQFNHLARRFGTDLAFSKC